MESTDATQSESRWAVGDLVVLREVWQGKVWSGRPVIVARDTPEVVALYSPAGTPWRKPVTLSGGTLRIPKQEWALADETQRIEILRLRTPGVPHSVLVLWLPGFSSFLRWYVNLERPLTRTKTGFDFMDLTLDIVISADQSEWKWKDEDELDEALERGLISAEQAGALRKEGEIILENMQNGEPPFSQGWEQWRPDPTWTRPVLPEGWDRLP